MKKLHVNWITEGIIDFEYKKYILLAYLKRINEKFHKMQLYPSMGDLVHHYNNLLALKNNKKMFIDELPKELTGIDLKRLNIVYKEVLLDDALLDEIFAVVHYALPKFTSSLEHGKELYDWAENQMVLDAVGLLPLYKNEGYLLIAENAKKDALIYRYRLSSIAATGENYYTLSTEFLMKEKISLANTLHSIKLNLIKRFTNLPNPATYALLSKMHFPLKSTLLPIGERMLIRQLAA